MGRENNEASGGTGGSGQLVQAQGRDRNGNSPGGDSKGKERF